MEPFEIMVSESQERMLCVVEPSQARRGARGLRALGGRRDRDRRGHGHAPPARLRRRRAGRRHARHRAGRRVPGLRPVARRADRRRSTPRRPRCCRRSSRPRCCSGCWRRPTSRRASGRSSSTTRSSARAPSAAPSRPTPRCSCSRSRRRRSTAPAATPLTLLYPPTDAAGPRPAIAVAIDGNGRRVAADPYRGAVEAVIECSANLACVGAEPLGLTNCLNFGNPEKPHIAWQLTRAVAGLGDACRAFGVPVVGGNVSLYNEGAEGPIYPTPVVGLVGELPDANRAGRLGFTAAGDAIALVTAGWAPVARGLGALQAARRAGGRPAPVRRPRPAQGSARRDPPGRPRRQAALRPRRRRGRRRDRARRVRAGLRPRRRRLGPELRGGAVRRGAGRLPRLRPAPRPSPPSAAQRG